MEKNKVIRFQIRHALLFTGVFAVIFLAFFFMIARQYKKYVNLDEIALKKYFHDFKEQINNRFYQLENRLRQIRFSVEADLFDSRATGLKFPAAYQVLKNNTAGNYFHMDDTAKLRKAQSHINITGTGKFHNRNLKFSRLLRMGLNLSDEFHALKETFPNIIYIYHTSKENFIVHYPWFSSKDFRFTKGLYDYKLWNMSLPENNPKHKVYWTEAYIDSSGEGGGIMTTCAIPIYDENDFAGLIGVDLTVDFLNSLVDNFEPQRKGGVVIFDKENNLMALPNSISYKDKAIKKLQNGLPPELAKQLKTILSAPNDTILETGNWKYIKSNFANAPFSLLYYFSQEDAVSRIINNIGYGTMGVLLCLLILVFASLYITHKKLIQPTDKFVNFILAKSKGGDVEPDKNVPLIWQPWFSTIDNVFNENNQLTESIRQSNIVLENKNAELEREIEAKNKAEKEKEALEEQLIQEEKLKAIGLLSGGIAHDFNNQLAVIMGYASVLRSQVKLDDKKRNQCLDQILAAASSSSGLTKQLLAFAQKGKYQNVPVDVHKIITEVITILNHTIDKRISIKVDFEASYFTVKGDPAQIQNVVMNIAINAKNAMPNGGMITFRTTNVTLTEEDCAKSEFDIEPGNFIKISIVDTGSGITDEHKKHIFEPFFTTNNSGHGNGLGLAAAMGAIKNHRGDISVDSAPGMGADFCIKLPVMSKNAKPKEPFTAYKLNVSISKSKLLLIDDETAFCRMLTDFMGALGYTIITYSDPLKAIEYYRDSWEEIDLVIVDMMMPKLSGHDVITEFEKVNNDVKFVISSGYSPEEVTQQLLQNDKHIKGFYKKPFDVVKFSNEIAYLLTQKD